MPENEEKYGIVIALVDPENEEPRNFLFQYEIYELEEDEREDEDEPDFIPQAVVTVRELTEDEIDSLDGDINENGLGTLVCSLNGWLIMSNLMKSYDYDPHYLCDAESQDLEYCWSALTDPMISALSLFEDQGNIFYVDTITIEPDYLPENDESGIITGILSDIISIINQAYSANDDDEKDPDTTEFIINGGARCVDTIAYYPAALPYDDSIKKKESDLACSLVSQLRGEMIEQMLGSDNTASEKPEIEVKVAPELYLRSAGMRVSGDTYPESAKNRKEWDLLEAAGWYECGNSRLLYKTFRDD